MTDTLDSDNLLTLSEVAVYLKVAEKTVHRMVKKGEIPCFKVASQWRFKKSGIDSWLQSKLRTSPSDEITELLENSPELVPFSRLISPERILADLNEGSKEDILEQLIQPLLEEGFLDRSDDYLKKLIEREKMISTAIGHGIALPHIRHPQENPETPPVVVIGRCKKGVEYESLDNAPTHLFFLIFTNSIKVHLRLTSRINRILLNKTLITELIAADSNKEIYKLMTDEDKIILSLEKSSKGE